MKLMLCVTDRNMCFAAASSFSMKINSPPRNHGTTGLIQLHNVEPFILSDLSSINAAPPDEEEESYNFKPAIGAPCANSIPAADAIINQVIDKVILHDEQQEAASRLRAIRLSISTAWTSAFNN